MSLHAAVHAGLRAIWAADIGAGGVNLATSPAVIRFWARRGHPDVDVARTQNWPYVLTDCTDEPRDRFGTVVQGATVQGRILVCARRDGAANNTTGAFDTLDAVVARLRVILKGATLASAGGWLFSPIARVKQSDPPHSGTDIRAAIDFRILAVNRSNV